MKNSKLRIIHTAAKLFAKKGFDSVSVREICKEAKVNVCMISYYFGGKSELYRAIIDDLIKQQVEYAKDFIDFDLDFSTLKKQEQIELLHLVIDKFVDFFYSKISKDLIIILLKEQQNQRALLLHSPAVSALRRLIAAVFDNDINDREIIFKTLFIMSQVNIPRILPAFSLKLLGQDNFLDEDIKLIKENVKFYINSLIAEAKIV